MTFLELCGRALASKMAPKKYGDKVETKLIGDANKNYWPRYQNYNGIRFLAVYQKLSFKSLHMIGASGGGLSSCPQTAIG